jgi:hypothetical protein
LKIRDDQFSVRGPLEDVEVECVALHGGVAPRLAIERRARAAVDAFAIDVEPLADAGEDARGVLVDRSIALRTDVEQRVAALGGDLGDQLDAELGRLVVVVDLL